jgi:hypothetical protein
MKTTTVKTVEQALVWIDTTPHHMFDTHFKRGQWRNGRQIADDKPSHFVLVGNGERIRIPWHIWVHGVSVKIRPNPRPFDTCMYALTKNGKEWLRKQMRLATGKTIFEELLAEGMSV